MQYPVSTSILTTVYLLLAGSGDVWIAIAPCGQRRAQVVQPVHFMLSQTNSFPRVRFEGVSLCSGYLVVIGWRTIFLRVIAMPWARPLPYRSNFNFAPSQFK